MDVNILANNPSPSQRADLAQKIAVSFDAEAFSAPENNIAKDILRLLAHDVEVTVRKALSESLAHSMLAPHDVIVALANDVAEVALPVLQYSGLLTEQELIEIVRSSREVVKWAAIARRETVPKDLSDALAATNDQKVLYTLLYNKGAILSDPLISDRWDSLTGNPSLLEALVHRGGLSVCIAERLFATVTDELKQHLAKHYRLPLALVDENSEDIREWTTLGMLLPEGKDPRTEKEVEQLAHQLYVNNRLTYSLIIRSLSTGEFDFFEAAMARLANVPRKNARILMFDGGTLGFKAFYRKARMPEGFYDAIRILLRISLEIAHHGQVSRADFCSRVIDRICKEGYDKSIENMQHLLTIIGGHVEKGRVIH